MGARGGALVLGSGLRIVRLERRGRQLDAVDAGTYRAMAQTNPPRTIANVVVSMQRETNAALR